MSAQHGVPAGRGSRGGPWKGRSVNLFALTLFPHELCFLIMILVFKVFRDPWKCLEKMYLFLSSGMRTTYPGQSQVWTQSIWFSQIEESLNSIWLPSFWPGPCPLVRTIYSQARTWKRASGWIPVPHDGSSPAKLKCIGSSSCCFQHSSSSLFWKIKQ